MNERSQQDVQDERDDETVARLLQVAGERAGIAPDVEARVYDQVFEEWNASTATPNGKRVYHEVRRAWRKASRPSSRRRWLMPAALAASVALVAVMLLRPAPVVTPPILAGTIVKVITDTSSSTLPAEGAQVFVGESLQTGVGEGVSLRLTSNESLRLGENTSLAIVDVRTLRLDAGRIYADTGEFVYRDRGLLVETGLGQVRDIGTQFAVSYDSQALDVAVREGRVDVRNSGRTLVAVAGEVMTLTPSADAVITPLSPTDKAWDWASELAPDFEIHNKSVLDFLRWAARETGRELVFADEDLRMDAMRADMHGSVAGFRPAEAIESVLSTSAFEYQLLDDKILIRR